jgi:integrase
MLGHPLQMNNLGQREYAKLIKRAKVRPIKFHGLRHTCATLLLQARQPVHVVSERLGHSKVSMTMEVYAHVLPDMQQDAATTLGALLHAVSNGCYRFMTRSTVRPVNVSGDCNIACSSLTAGSL